MPPSALDEAVRAVESYTSQTEPLLAPSNERVAPASDDAPETIKVLLGDKFDISTDHSWGAEAWLLFRYAVPLVGTYLLQYFYSVVTIFVAGHVGADSLAAASIGVMTMNIVGFAIFDGMATAMDTLCAQAYGTGNLKGVGVHIQRSLVLMSLAMVPVAAIWLTSPFWLRLFVKQDFLPAMAGRFLQISVVGIPGYASFETGKRFVQAQGEFRSSLVVLLICAPINVLLNWVFVFKLHMGLDGAALAAALTNTIRPILFAAYVSLLQRWTLQCWGGWTKAAWKNWGPMINLSLAGAMLNVSEWFAFEIMTFSTSYLSTKHIAAQTILTTTSVLAWHIPFSMSIAVTTRIGHLIGAGRINAARRAAIFYGIVFFVIGLFDGTLIFSLGGVIPKFFSEDADVQAIAAKTIPVVATFQIIDAMISACTGILRGLGRQSVAAWSATLVNYTAAVPTALWLELGNPKLGLYGVWIGLQGGMYVIYTIEILVMKLMSWKLCVEDVRERERQQLDEAST